MENTPYVPGGSPPTSEPPAGGSTAPPVEGQAPPAGGPPPAQGEQGRTAGAPKPLEDLHIDELLHVVVDKNASDLHICTDAAPVIREDGDLVRLNYEKFTPQITQRMLYEIISDDNVTKFEQTKELDFSYALPTPLHMRKPGQTNNIRARFRVNMYRDRGSVAAAFRLISSKIPTVEELNLPPILKQLSEKPRGLILVTGPTGSGKSTSLAAMINHINMNFSHHIITIEDPVEYLHVHKSCIINQRELGQDTLSFNNALRASLREDPDVLLVGEMRDMETIQLAITAAETGHLVFATLHTNNAAESIDRIIDVFPPGQQEQIRVQLSNNIIAIISQQLLPRVSGPGRLPANEIMIATPAIRNLIRENKTHQIPSSIQTSAQNGMVSMDQCLRDMYMKGLITLDEAMTRCTNPEELKKMINLGGPGEGSGGRPGNNRR